MEIEFFLLILNAKKWCLTKAYLSRSKRLSTVPANRRTEDKYTVLVVRMAAIVPIGILFWASAKSPERFEPAIIPANRKDLNNILQIEEKFKFVHLFYDRRQSLKKYRLLQHVHHFFLFIFQRIGISRDFSHDKHLNDAKTTSFIHILYTAQVVDGSPSFILLRLAALASLPIQLASRKLFVIIKYVFFLKAACRIDIWLYGAGQGFFSLKLFFPGGWRWLFLW